MLKTYDMRFRKVSAAGRAFWLWFVATALIVLSMAVSPNVAFAADEVQDIPEGVITFVDAGDTDSSPAVVEQEPVVASTSQEEIPEGVVTFDEPEAAEETQDASTNIPVGDSLVVEQEQTAPAQQEATNDQVASNETPQEGAEQQNAQENAPKRENADNGDKEELASNNSSDDNVQQAVEDEPAINPVQIDEEQATVLDSNEPATQEPIITDAPANAPPMVDNASNADETSVASTDTNNSDITQNAEEPVVASNGSSMSAASNAAVQIDQNVSDTASITAQAFSVNIPLYFYDTYTGSGTSITSATVGPNNDYVYTYDGQYLTVSSTPYMLTFTGSELPNEQKKSYIRYGTYEQDGFYVDADRALKSNPSATSHMRVKLNWSQLNSTISGYINHPSYTFSNIELHASYKPQTKKKINYYSTDHTIGKVKSPIDMTTATIVELPTEEQKTSMGNYDPTTFDGWYFYLDTNYDEQKMDYYVKATSQPLTGSETVWDVLKRYFNIQEGANYNSVYWTTITDYVNNFLVVPALKDPNVSISYSVTYTNTNASGNANGETATETYSSAGQTAGAKPATFTIPTEDGYTFTFAGWKTPSGTSTIKVGDALTNAWGASTPANNGAYTLLAVWTRAAQTYTVVYNSNGWRVTVTENDHEINNASTEQVKDVYEVWTGENTGYQFDGWALTSGGDVAITAAQVAAGKSLQDALSPVSGETYTLYAKWTEKKYTINFNYDVDTTVPGNAKPGTTQFINTVGATSLSTMTPSADIPVYNTNLKKTGYVFGGWKDSAGTKVANKDNSIIAGTTLAKAAAGSTQNLTAIWNEITYTINWYAKWTSTGSTVTPFNGQNASTGDYTYTQATTKGLEGDAGTLPASLTADYLTTEDGKEVKYTWNGWYVTRSGSAWTSAGAGTSIEGLTLADAVAVSGAKIDLDETNATAVITIFGVWNKPKSKTISFVDETGPGEGPGGSATVYVGEDYRIKRVPVNVNGYHFTGWKSSVDNKIYTLANVSNTSASNNADNTIFNITGDIDLVAQWEKNKVNFVLLPGTDASGVDLKEKATAPQAEVGDTVGTSFLTDGTPTRNGYDFVGWSKTKDGSVIIGGSENKAYTVLDTDAPSDPGTITLYATWKPWTYTVRYWKNVGTDTAHDVTVWQQSSPGDWTNLGSTIDSEPYVWTAKTAETDTGLASPDIILTRDYYKDRQYVRWGTSPSATTAITNDQTLKAIYASTGRTDRIIDLYPIWESIKYTVNYLPKNSNGTVNPITETIDLAIGTDDNVKGSTATPAAGYQLDVPTWTDLGTTVASGCKSDEAQATYKPKVEYLRNLYKSVPSSTSHTFYANFTEAEYAYTVQAFMQKANGSYNTTWSSTNDLEWTQLGTKPFTAKLNSSVDYSKVISGVTATALDGSTLNGKTLADLALVAATTPGVSNNVNLYELDTSKGDAMSIVITSTPANNILKLYYKRTTYDLVAEFKTTDENTNVTNDAPEGVTSTAASHLNGGSSTTGLRWGESVNVTSPSKEGYTFAWLLTQPTAPNASTNPGSTFALDPADMDKLKNAGLTQAKLTGMFTVVSYKITLIDGTPTAKNWDASTPGQELKNSGTTFTYVASNKTLASWLPSSVDRPNVDTLYLAGWEDADNPGVVIAPDALRAVTNWTKKKTYTAVWYPKVVITYDPGSKDSNDQSKADWVSASRSFTDLTDPSSVILSSTDAAFEMLINAMDGTKPRGKAGWEFAYWMVDGDTGAYRYGHDSAYPTSEGGEPNGRYLKGTTGSDGINLAKSITFIAYWTPVAQTLDVNDEGPVVNNPDYTSDRVEVDLPVVTKTYGTDDLVDMADYAPINIPDGYELVGWDWVFTPVSGAEESGTYNDPNVKFHIKHGTKTTLTPRFNEKKVTFTYEIASGQASRGSIDPSTSDTVFAVRHNGINAHTASSSNTDAFSFSKWTYDSATVVDVEDGEQYADGVINATRMNIPSNVVLTDRTYVASFNAIQYKLIFSGQGTDGTTSMGTVTASGTGAGVDNSFKVDWGSTIPSGGLVTVEVPEGYELDGWIVDGAGAPQEFSGANTANKGVYNYVVKKNTTLTAHFKVSTKQDYTVKYNYDPDGMSLYSGSEKSRAIAWGENVLPSAPDDAPVQPGFTFDGWYIDEARTIAITGVDATFSQEFGKIYKKLAELNADKPNYDPDTKSITIYGKWTAETFKVAYDLYGNVANDTTTTADDVVVWDSEYVATKTNVGWYDLASTFKREACAPTQKIRFERPGYKLDGWSATYTVGGVTTETSTNVLNSDTYGKLAGNLGTVKTVTLHAIWSSRDYLVEYQYNDGQILGGSDTPSKTESVGWAELVNYYGLGAAPNYGDEWTFDGWDVTYWTPARTEGARLTGNADLTMRDIVGGNTDAIAVSGAIIRFTAHWTHNSHYYFQDRFIYLDGTYMDKDRTSDTQVGGDETVYFTSYPWSTDKYENDGYDFDNHTATNPKWNTATPTEKDIAAGSTVPYYVYYLERSYTIDFYTNGTDSASSWITSDNAWESAAAKLPTATPTKPGFSFAGWYLTTTDRPEDGAELTGSNTIKSTGVYANAPVKSQRLKAVAKWVEDTATIEWDTTANGTTSPASPGSVSIAATDANPFNASGATFIKATPDAGGDYVFWKWTYEYTDPSDPTTLRSGDVTEGSQFATLGGTDGDELTPKQWAMHTSEAAVWHDIKFIAHFALSSDLVVTINYYYENADKAGQPDDVKYDRVVTKKPRGAKDGELFTFTPEIEDGYTLNEGLTKSKDFTIGIDEDGKISKMYDYSDPTTQVINVYLDALEYNVTYKYVLSDGSDQTPPVGATPLSSFDNRSVKTGATYTVSTAPTFEGYEFKGWYFSDNYGTLLPATFDMPAKNVTIVGTWEPAYHTVHFVSGKSDDPAVVAGCFVSETSGGYTVQYGSKVKTATNPSADAATLSDLGVTINNAGKHYTLTGWDVLKEGVKQGTTIGISDPLDFVVTYDVTFRGVWSETYAVTYTHGAHGDFMDSTNTKPYVEFSPLVDGAALPAYNGTKTNDKPTAVAGWEWVGWGVKNGETWTYYFADEADIDYNSTTGTHESNLPANVTNNIEFVGFYKALERTLIFSIYEYDKNVPAGTQSSKQFDDDPQPALKAGTASTYTVKTGQNGTMLNVADVVREGYTLTGWTDGAKTYAPGSTNQFVMPDGPTNQVVYLYPVFNFGEVVITYEIATGQTTWGNLDNLDDTMTSPTDTIDGSKPTAMPGYEFDYWTQGSDTTHLGLADGVGSGNKLVPVGATGTVTFVAHFKEKKYNITLVKNASPIDEQETLPATTSFTNKVWTDEIDLGTPTRPGYDFEGWDVYDETTGTTTTGTKIRSKIAAGTNVKVSTLSTDDGTATELKLVPVWKAKAYKVIFNDGKTTGTGTITGMPTPNPRDCAYDSEDINASEPTREGYSFDGWQSSLKPTTDPLFGAGTLKYKDLVNGESDTEVTLTAKWTPNSHTLTYEKEGADTWSTDSSKYPADDPAYGGTDAATTGALAVAPISTATDEVIELRTPATITRTGSKLVGWKVKGGTTEYRFVEGSTLTLTMPDDNVTLVPIWEESGDYNVYFVANDAGVQNVPGNRTNIAYSANDIDAHAPKRAGYTFTGWSSSVTTVSPVTAGTGKAYADLVGGNDTIKSVTLTATWKQTKDYEVLFVENGSGDPDDIITNMPDNQTDLQWGSTVTTRTIAGDPERAGYIFDGWVITDTEGTVLGNTSVTYFNAASALFSELAQNDDTPERKILTLTAHWTPKTYTVEFVENKPPAASGDVSGMPGTNPITGLQFGATGITVPTLTLEGYDFNGWTDSATHTVIAPGSYTYAQLSGNKDNILTVTLTADFTAKPHDLTYVISSGEEWSPNAADYPTSEPAGNGATDPNKAIRTKTDAMIDLRLATSVTRPGSTLVGWKDVTDNVEYLFSEGSTYKVPNRDVTLTPIFEENSDYNVYFFTGDAIGATKVDTSTMPENRTNIKYSVTDIDVSAPTRPGYIFGGWTNDVSTELSSTATTAAYAQLVGHDSTKKTVNLTAKWNKDTSFKVTYKDGVPEGASAPFTGTLPAPIPSLGFDDTVPQTELNTTGTERIGFTFDGWKITNDADGSVIATVTSGYADTIYSAIVGGDADIKAITFTAMWSGTPYKVTYHLTEGTWVNAKIEDEGKDTPDSPITRKCEQDVDMRLANTVKRDGYTLVGWANGTNKLDVSYEEYRFATTTSFSMPAHDVDLYPLWDAKTYTVYFVEKAHNDTGSIAVDSDSMPTSPQTGEYNDTFTYGAPTRTGYDFGGWDIYMTDEYDADPATASLLKHIGEGSGSYASLAGSADIDSLTLVAYWTPKKVGVTYVLDVADKAKWVKENIKDAGKDAPNNLVSYETGQTVQLREADTVSRDGYVLIGWKEDNSPTVTTAKYPFDANGHATLDMPGTNVVLYAVWKIKDGYTVVFDGNAPTTNLAPGATLENMPDDQPIAPAKLTWEGSTSFVDTHSPSFLGYTFKGWDVYDSDGVKINDGDPLIGPGYYFNTLAREDLPKREHLTLKAVWELALIYNVLFKDGVDAGDTPVNDGTMPEDQLNISYVATVDYHAPSRVGYTFDGWDVLDITVPTDEQAMPSISAEDAGSNPYYVLAGSNPDRKKLQLTARWIEKGGYNVHFVDKPESDTGATPVNMGSLTDYINIYWDDAVIAYPAPTRTGYDFQHWAVTDTTNADDPINIGSATAGSYTYSKLARNRTDDTIMDITLTAIWKAHEWTVTYVNTSDKGPGTWVKANIGDAGKNTPDAPVTYAVDETITLRDRTTLVMSGYKLVGWQDEEVETANTIKYMLDTVSEFLMPDHDVKLYPIWAPKVYTVIFDGNKPSEATDTSQIVTNLPPTQWTETDDGYPLAWNGDVDTHAPTLAGYSFKGWVIDEASQTGARTGLLNGATYKFSELALTDIMEHETLKLIAQWEPAKYRVNYVDPFDASGAAIATPAMIATDATKLWGDVVSDADPWTVSNPAYTGKSNDDWQFMGWKILDVNTNTYVALSTIANHAYSSLAKYENVTLADSATADETPALVLYASWARRVPFVVDFMKRDGSGNDTLETSETLVGLDGQDIETTIVDELSKTWKAYVLNTVGPNHGIPGYKYSATLSEPYVIGTLNANDVEPLHVKLIYTQLADYTIVYDAAPGASVSDTSKHTSTKGNLTWEDAGSKFPPNDSEWVYVGHKIAGWTYGPTGVEFDFDPSVKFGDIAEAIYGTVDGTEGRDADGDGTIEKPVTLFAKWVERTDYKVKYDNNYAVDDGKVKSGITDGRFLERVEDATYTPATKEDVAWSATDIEPTATDDIKKPGVKDGMELYVIDGWNYLSKSGVQKPAEGLSFAQIVADMFEGEPTDNEITLYARYKEIAIEIKYTPVLSDDDGNVISTGASAAGTVSRTVETPDVVTGTLLGSTATPNRGYHFVGWRRASDGEILLLNGGSALSGMASKAGYNVLPDGLGGATLLLAAQNTDDGYWHEEEYYALFAQNEMAILHYDKNAEDATGSIPDVEAPYETLIDLSDGSGFQRKYWTLVSWNTKPDGTGTTYALSQKDWEMPKGETTLYAQWVRNKAKLTYEPGGPDVTGIPDGIEDEWGTTHPVSDQQPKRDHYTFKGWNTKEDGTGTWWHPGDEIELPGDGIHLYAQWEINKYPVSVDPGPYTGGKVTYPGEGTWVIEHGGHLPEGYVTATPEPGYHVVGWRYTMTDEYGNVTTGIVSDPTELVVIGKVTFSAIFEADPVDEPIAPYEGYSGNGGLIPQTGDVNLVLVLAISGMTTMVLLLLIVAARRRRKEE